MIGLICYIVCAVISVSFLSQCHSTLDMFFCIAIETFYVRAATQKIKEMRQTKNNSAR